MKFLTGISQGFNKYKRATLQNNYFEEHLPMTASALKYDHESLKLFWYEEVVGRWIEIKIC